MVVKAVVNDLGCWVSSPRHDAHRGRVGAQLHVFVGGVNHVVIRPTLRKFAGHAHGHNGLRQAHATVLGELAPGQNFAAGHTSQVGYQALHLGHAALVEPLFKVVEIH